MRPHCDPKATRKPPTSPGAAIEYRGIRHGKVCLRGLALLRKSDGELGTVVDLAGDGGFAAVGFDDGFDQAQPEAQAALGPAFVAPVEAGPDLVLLLDGDADAGVPEARDGLAGL